MSRVTEAGMDGAVEEDVQRTEQRAVGEREVRWSARRKEGVVMRLLLVRYAYEADDEEPPPDESHT